MTPASSPATLALGCTPPSCVTYDIVASAVVSMGSSHSKSSDDEVSSNFLHITRAGGLRMAPLVVLLPLGVFVLLVRVFEVLPACPLIL